MTFEDIAHNYNADLWDSIKGLRQKREELNRAIAADEEEKATIRNQLPILTERLSRINNVIDRKVASRNEYDNTIAETEGAYRKILETVRSNCRLELPLSQPLHQAVTAISRPGPSLLAHRHLQLNCALLGHLAR